MLQLSHRPTVTPVFDRLLATRDERGAVFAVLVDPDKLSKREAAAFAARCSQAGADVLFLGGSLMHQGALDSYVDTLKSGSKLPVIGFPGTLNQIAPSLDALLYLSVVSGRNPEFLIGQHVHAAPMIRQMELETISTAYLLIESGRMNTAQYMSGSMPIPRHKPEIAAATALAAEMMGMKLIFTDAGSGAEHPVSCEVVSAITQTCRSPLVVGGGLCTPEAVASRVEAGASIVVVGHAIEERMDDGVYIAELAAAAHASVAQPIGR